MLAYNTGTEAEVEALERSRDNQRINTIYEGKLSPEVYLQQVIMEDPSTDSDARLQFIRHKYQDRTYFDAEEYKKLLEEAATGSPKSKSRVKRAQTHDGSIAASPAPRNRGLHADPPRRPKQKKANSCRVLSSDSESDTPGMGYSLPSHLGPGQPKPRNLLNKVKAKANASAKTRRGRRKSSGDRPEAAGLKSSTSTPNISRWNTSSPPRDGRGESRWNTEASSSSQKNFAWGNSSDKPPSSKANANAESSRVPDIAALRDNLGNNGFKPRAPQRILSDGSGDDTTHHERKPRFPHRVSSDSEESSRPRERGVAATGSGSGGALRMPRRHASDDDGGDEDTDRSTSLRTPMIDPESLLSRRRSLPALTLGVKDEDDSIRNQYGGPNCVFSGHRQRTTGRGPDEKPGPKYGIKMKYGFDSCTDTDSERQRKPKPKGLLLERAKTEELANVPTLGIFLGSKPAPNRILGGRSINTASESEEDVRVHGVRNGRSFVHTRGRHAGRAKSHKLSRKGPLFDHLNTAKKVASDHTPSKARSGVALRGLQKLTDEFSAEEMSVTSGFSFHSTSTDEDVSLVRPKATLQRGRSCGGLGMMAITSGMDDSGLSFFSRGSRDSNVW